VARDPDQVYHGFINNAICDWCFVLFAEDRGLLSTDPIYSNYYSITGLYERLRADAWVAILTQWISGTVLGRNCLRSSDSCTPVAATAHWKIPAREGYLFDPGRYLFLEGRHDKKDKPEIPRVSDGVVYRVLNKIVTAGWRAAELSNSGR